MCSLLALNQPPSFIILCVRIISIAVSETHSTVDETAEIFHQYLLEHVQICDHDVRLPSHVKPIKYYNCM